MTELGKTSPPSGYQNIGRLRCRCIHLWTDGSEYWCCGAGKLVGQTMSEKIDHPAHYGGKGNPYEAIKVIEAWGLNFRLGNAVKYISRAGKKGDMLEDLKKAAWYLQREIDAQREIDDQQGEGDD